MQYKNICLGCNITFVSSKKLKYCSEDCRKKVKNERQKQRRAENIIKYKKTNKIYNNRRKYKQKVYVKKKPEYKEKICECCKIIFTPKTPTGKYCSNICAYKIKRLNLKKDRRENPIKYINNKKRYNKNRDLKKLNENKKVLKYMKFECYICKSKFTPNSIHQKCCSIICKNKYLNEKKIIKRQNNIHKFRKRDINYYLKNKFKIRKRRNKRAKELYDNDILYKLKKTARCRLRQILKTKNIIKNEKMIKYLGCSIEKLKKVLEKQFDDKMTWDNYGFYGWHIDHIIPLNEAHNEHEVYKLFHYKNLQPLWATDNLSKGAKVEN